MKQPIRITNVQFAQMLASLAWPDEPSEKDKARLPALMRDLATVVCKHYGGKCLTAFNADSATEAADAVVMVVPPSEHDDAPPCWKHMGRMEVFGGMFDLDGASTRLDFHAIVGANTAVRDASALACLAQHADIEYAALGDAAATELLAEAKPGDPVEGLTLALQAAVARVEIANAQGDPILSAWLPDARQALASVQPPANTAAQHADETGRLVGAIHAAMTRLRQIAQEPVSVPLWGKVDMEVRPGNDDDRVLIGREGWGFTTVNYTSEGVIVDVVGEFDVSPMHTASIEAWDLVQKDMQLLITTPLTVQTCTGQALELLPVPMHIGTPSRHSSLFARFLKRQGRRLALTASEAAKVQAYMRRHGTEALSEDGDVAWTLCGDGLAECLPEVCARPADD